MLWSVSLPSQVRFAQVVRFHVSICKSRQICPDVGLIRPCAVNTSVRTPWSDLLLHGGVECPFFCFSREALDFWIPRKFYESNHTITLHSTCHFIICRIAWASGVRTKKKLSTLMHSQPLAGPQAQVPSPKLRNQESIALPSVLVARFLRFLPMVYPNIPKGLGTNARQILSSW